MNQRVKDLQSLFKEEYNLNLNENEVIRIKDKMEEILSVQKYYEDDLTIKKGDEYLCIKDFSMVTGEPRFIAGKTYISPKNESLINDNGDFHLISEKHIKVHFRKKKNLL